MELQDWIGSALLAVFFILNGILHINKTIRLDILEKEASNLKKMEEIHKGQLQIFSKDLEDTRKVLRTVLTYDVSQRWKVYDPHQDSLVMGHNSRQLPYMLMNQPDAKPIKKVKNI